MNPAAAPGAVAPSTSILSPRRAWVAGATAVLAAGAMATAIGLNAPGPAASPADPLAAAATAAATAPSAHTAPQRLAPSAPRATPPAAPGPVARDAAPLCAHCGTVASVKAVKQKGQASGTGAVIGGVLGAVVGNQMGKGNGRKAMTALGAVGGGMAGHEIEKRRNATTVYQVTVRLDDGSQRTVTRPEPWTVGRRVQLDGQDLRALKSAPGHAPA